MAEHKHGKMDVTEHEKTFEGFVKATVWSVMAIIVVLVLVAMINA